MTYPCLDCKAELESFDDAMAHNNETDHEIGPYQGGSRE